MRTAITALTLTAMALTTAPAWADTTAPAPITISSDQVKQICEQRVPRLEERITALTKRIQAGPGVAGSVQWLQAQAKRAQDTGHQDIATRLTDRADRRQGDLAKLDDASKRLDAFKAAHCG
ncbi:hypothetical protein [Kutzneria buriramensis]|uniref:Secreted protein n=1 Tax=Kutzneria buriramensis TaxID=1045776 RepID=A0A3E0HUS1_9PSEU|nr:hypothetical protein [Kutzneria buriramensis]REH50207.1 hypothetical protein BCF44_104483 [Kutzneria buriramensis]